MTTATTYDNSNTVALFANADATQLSGPIYFDGDTEFRCVVTLSTEGSHAAEVFKRGKSGEPVGKPLLKGTVSRVTSRNAEAPTALMVLEGKSQVRRFALWRKDHVRGAYYQGRVDQIEKRDAPVL